MGKVEISLSTLDLMLQIIKGVIDNSIPIGQLGAKLEYELKAKEEDDEYRKTLELFNKYEY